MKAEVFESVRRGAAYTEVARAHDVSVARVRRIVARESKRRAPERAEVYCRTQIAGLERTVLALGETVDGGDWRAARALPSLLDALDRYHGFSADDLRGQRSARDRAEDPLATIFSEIAENNA